RRAGEQEFNGAGIAKSMRMPVLDLGELEDSGEVPRPVGHGRTDVLAGPEVPVSAQLDRVQRLDDLRWHGHRDWLSGLGSPHEDAPIRDLVLRQTDGIADSETRVAHRQDE